MTPIALGLLLNSALYLAGVFIAGLYAQNHVAVIFALMSTGCCAFCYGAQLAGQRYSAFAILTSTFSWLLGIAALVALAVEYLR